MFTLIKILLVYVVEIPLLYVVFKIYHAMCNRYFKVEGRKYKYLINIHNAVISGRVIEIPFVIDYLRINEYEHKSVLEVGNVLSHYFDFNHEIVDKYEKQSFITNMDIIDYNPNKKYDIIISISTIEHIGFDESIRENGKSKKAIQKIIDLLDDNGIAVITVPLKYNPEIDSIVENNEIKFQKKYFLKRNSRFNLWKETGIEEAMESRYGASICFLIYYKNSQ